MDPQDLGMRNDGPVCTGTGLSWRALRYLFDAQRWFTGKDLPANYRPLDVQKVLRQLVYRLFKRSTEDPDFLLTVDSIKREAEHGEIQEGEWVVMRTDWDSRAGDVGKFLNFYDDAPHSPGPTAEAVQYLMTRTSPAGAPNIGTDVVALGEWSRCIQPTTCCT